MPKRVAVDDVKTIIFVFNFTADHDELPDLKTTSKHSRNPRDPAKTAAKRKHHGADAKPGKRGPGRPRKVDSTGNRPEKAKSLRGTGTRRISGTAKNAARKW